MRTDADISLDDHTPLIETPPWGITNQPAFLNAVARVETVLSPFALLDALKAAESRIGRRQTRRWGPRVIDLDILMYGGLILHARRLTIPHPELLARDFVIRQMVALDSDLLHPERKRPLLDFLA